LGSKTLFFPNRGGHRVKKSPHYFKSGWLPHLLGERAVFLERARIVINPRLFKAFQFETPLGSRWGGHTTISCFMIARKDCFSRKTTTGGSVVEKHPSL